MYNLCQMVNHKANVWNFDNLLNIYRGLQTAFHIFSCLILWIKQTEEKNSSK